MIKNSSQLKSAKERLELIRHEIEEYRQEYSSVEFEFYILPLRTEEQELMGEIEEFEKLKELPFEDAIQGPLRAPILIDNIGLLLSKLRLAAKLTQSEMADRLNWEQSNLSRFESENYSSQTISKIVEFASALGVYLYVSPSLTDRPEIIQDIFLRPNPRVTSQQELTSTSGGPLTDNWLDFIDLTIHQQNRTQYDLIANILQQSFKNMFHQDDAISSYIQKGITNEDIKSENLADRSTTA